MADPVHNYISTAQNAQQVQADLIAAIRSPADVIGIIRIPAHLVATGGDVAEAVRKAEVDFEIEALRTALYTFLQVTP